MGENKFGFMEWQKGQSLIELLLAIAIFVIVVSSLTFLILDSYVSGRLAQEMTTASFLAEEGLEAARSIRDSGWSKLIADNYGLVISETENAWDFSNPPEGTDVSDQLREGTRIITIEDIDSDRKKVTSQVTWQFAEGRSQEIKLVTYLTNWAKTGPYLAQIHYRWRNDDGGE